MTDEPDGERPEGSPRRRKHRRASSPATTGHPDAGHWTKDLPAGRSGGAEEHSEEGRGTTSNPGEQPERRVAGSDGRPESAQDRWWREQRPPHWG